MNNFIITQNEDINEDIDVDVETDVESSNTEDDNDDFDMSDTVKLIKMLGQNNPGAYVVVSKIFKKIDADLEQQNGHVTIHFIVKLIQLNIVGARLWYIYKHEAKLDINQLLDLDLNRFNDEYFYEKFEQFM